VRGREIDVRTGEVPGTRGRTGTSPGGGRERRVVWAALRSGVAVAAVAGMLVACGDDDEGDDVGGQVIGGDDGGQDATTVEDFCAQMDRMNVTLDSRGWFETDDAGNVTLDAVSSVDPPAEIAEEWSTVVDWTEQKVEAESNGEADLDGTDETRAAYERVVTYVDVQCSVYLGSS